jgi:hypothetical protein
MAGEIFISYRRADQDKARLLHALLKQRGVDAWYDALLGAGEDWRHKTAGALHAAPIFVLLFSKTASESDDISKELAAATFSKKLVIPVRIDDIRPEGAFLYELASRNWFDAFENTEARFEVLADQLAALVKGGPAAEVAAFNLGSTQPAPAIKPAAKKKGGALPLLIGAVVLIAALVGGAIGLGYIKLPGGAPATIALSKQRTAFFGLTADPGDAVASAVARSVGDEVFQIMNTYNLETASRAETEGVKLADQIGTAKKLGAAWALSGEVRTQGDKVVITLRLDDVVAGRTLWQDAITGKPSETTSLPVVAAAKASRLMRSLLSFQGRIVGADPKANERIDAIFPRAAADIYTPTQETVKLWREIATLAPKSADAQAELAFTLQMYLQQFGQTILLGERLALFQEMAAAAKRAVELDPTHALARGILGLAGIIQGRPLAEVERDMRAAIAEAPKDGPMSAAFLTNPTGSEILILMTGGRFQEALPRARSVVQIDPTNPTTRVILLVGLAQTGSPAEAARLIEDTNARLPTTAAWELWVTKAAFEGIGDVQRALNSAPSIISGDTLACWRDIVKASQSADPQVRRAGAGRVSQCVKAGNVLPVTALQASASLGELDSAFASAEQILVRTNSTFTVIASLLYGPPLRAMRADPRFLPLMQKATIYQYWLDTGTHPDVCDDPAEKDFPVCVALRKDQAK